MFNPNRYVAQTQGLLGPLPNQLNNGNRGFLWSILGGYSGLGGYEAPGPDSEGWYDYCGCPAPPNALCQFKQGWEEDEGDPWIGYSRNFAPEFNVAYLKWRYTGIAKEERGL